MKQRLVGGVVLVALAVIFVPMLLDGSGTRVPGAEDIEIPPRPEPPKPLPLPVDEPITLNPAPDTPEPEIAVVDRHNRDRVQAEVEATRPPPDSQKQTQAEAPPESLSTPPVSEELVSWVVQVAAYSDLAKAEAQRDLLRAKGLAPAFVERYHSERGDFYRVRIGPLVQREEAEAMRERADKVLGTKGRVMHHK